MNKPGGIMSKKKSSYVIVVALSLMVLTALWTAHCKFKPEKEKAFTGQPEEVTFCHSAFLDTLILIAYEEGYFRKNGIDITLKQYSTGGRSINRMFNNECDVSVSAGSPIVFQSFRHPDLRVLSTIGFSDNGVKIFARKDRGIEKPTDLKGKNIAAQKGTSFHFFLSLFLTKHGLSVKDVNLSFTRAEEMELEEAWERFDAISLKEPYGTDSVKLLGENAVVFEDRGLILVTFNVVSRSSYINKHPEAIRRLLKAMVQAEEFAKEHPEKIFDLITKTHKYDKGKWDLLMADTYHVVSLEQQLLLTLEDEARWTISEGLADKKEVPNYLDFIYLDGLESVKPEAVTILR